MKVLTLLKARLKENLFTRSYLKDLYRRDRLWVLPLAGAGITAAAGFFILLLYKNYEAILFSGLESGSPEIVILFASIISGLFIFFIGTPLCLSNIFYSKDNIMLAALPVAPADIVFSRVLSVYLFTLPVHLAVTVPALAVYLPAAYCPEAVFASLLLSITGSVVPLLCSMAAAWALAALGALSGHRTAFEIIGMIAVIILAAALQLAAGRTIFSGGDITQFSSVLTTYTRVLERLFFASGWIAAAFTGGGAVFGILSLLFPAAAAALAALMLKTFRLSLPGRVKTRRRKKSARAAVPPAGSSVTGALVKREWMVVRSCSAFLMETIAEVIILPILLAVFYFAMPAGMMDYIREFTSELDFLPLAAFGILVLMSSINSVSATSLSREGGTFAISKIIPVSGSIQVGAKLIFHMILFGSAWVLNMIVLMLIFRLPPVHLVYLLPAGPAVTALGFAASIHIDLARPVLKWTHPQQAMKQNMNVLIGMGFGFLTCALITAPIVLLYMAGLNQLLIGLIVTLASAAAAAILLPGIIRKAGPRYTEISC